MKTKHTQGEWTLRKGINDVISKDKYIIAQIASANNNEDEALANAKLIASAPDLLKAAISLTEDMDCKDSFEALIKAIKKATA